MKYQTLLIVILLYEIFCCIPFSSAINTNCHNFNERFSLNGAEQCISSPSGKSKEEHHIDLRFANFQKHYFVIDYYNFYHPVVTPHCQCTCGHLDGHCSADHFQRQSTCAAIQTNTTICSNYYKDGEDIRLCPKFYKICCQTTLSVKNSNEKFRAMKIKSADSFTFTLNINDPSQRSTISINIPYRIKRYLFDNNTIIEINREAKKEEAQQLWLYYAYDSKKILFSSDINEEASNDLRKLGWFQVEKNTDKITTINKEILQEALETKVQNCRDLSYSWRFDGTNYYRNDTGIISDLNTRFEGKPISEFLPDLFSKATIDRKTDLVSLQAKDIPKMTVTVYKEESTNTSLIFEAFLSEAKGDSRDLIVIVQSGPIGFYIAIISTSDFESTNTFRIELDGSFPHQCKEAIKLDESATNDSWLCLHNEENANELCAHVKPHTHLPQGVRTPAQVSESEKPKSNENMSVLFNESSMPSGTSSLSTGEVFGIVFGSLAFLAIIGICFIYRNYSVIKTKMQKMMSGNTGTMPNTEDDKRTREPLMNNNGDSCSNDTVDHTQIPMNAITTASPASDLDAETVVHVASTNNTEGKKEDETPKQEFTVIQLPSVGWLRRSTITPLEEFSPSLYLSLNCNVPPKTISIQDIFKDLGFIYDHKTTQTQPKIAKKIRIEDNGMSSIIYKLCIDFCRQTSYLNSFQDAYLLMPSQIFDQNCKLYNHLKKTGLLLTIDEMFEILKRNSTTSILLLIDDPKNKIQTLDNSLISALNNPREINTTVVLCNKQEHKPQSYCDFWDVTLKVVEEKTRKPKLNENENNLDDYMFNPLFLHFFAFCKDWNSQWIEKKSLAEMYLYFFEILAELYTDGNGHNYIENCLTLLSKTIFQNVSNPEKFRFEIHHRIFSKIPETPRICKLKPMIQDQNLRQLQFIHPSLFDFLCAFYAYTESKSLCEKGTVALKDFPFRLNDSVILASSLYYQFWIDLIMEYNPTLLFNALKPWKFWLAMNRINKFGQHLFGPIEKLLSSESLISMYHYSDIFPQFVPNIWQNRQKESGINMDNDFKMKILSKCGKISLLKHLVWDLKYSMELPEVLHLKTLELIVGELDMALDFENKTLYCSKLIIHINVALDEQSFRNLFYDFVLLLNSEMHEIYVSKKASHEILNLIANEKRNGCMKGFKIHSLKCEVTSANDISKIAQIVDQNRNVMTDLAIKLCQMDVGNISDRINVLHEKIKNSSTLDSYYLKSSKSRSGKINNARLFEDNQKNWKCFFVDKSFDIPQYITFKNANALQIEKLLIHYLCPNDGFLQKFFPMIKNLKCIECDSRLLREIITSLPLDKCKDITRVNLFLAFKKDDNRELKFLTKLSNLQELSISYIKMPTMTSSDLINFLVFHELKTLQFNNLDFNVFNYVIEFLKAISSKPQIASTSIQLVASTSNVSFQQLPPPANQVSIDQLILCFKHDCSNNMGDLFKLISELLFQNRLKQFCFVHEPEQLYDLLRQYFPPTRDFEVSRAIVEETPNLKGYTKEMICISYLDPKSINIPQHDYTIVI